MSAILPFHRSAVTSRRFARSGRKLSAAVNHAPHFAAAQLAEVEARYAQLLASAPDGEYGLSEPTVATLGTPKMDQIDLETAIAMVGAPGDRLFLLNLQLGCEVVELTPAKARDAADALRRTAAALDTLAADAEALAAIEAEH